MLGRIINWFNVEPTVSMLMVITAIMLFASAYRSHKETSSNLWPWLRKALESSVTALLFVGLMWSFRMVLNDNISTFYSTHGSLSEISRSSAWSIWGRPHTQLELSVSHTHDVEVKDEIPRTDLSQPLQYRTTIHTEAVAQNSIAGFTGDIQMQLSKREKGYALYSGYTIDASFAYDIINDSAFETDAEFTFPLTEGQALFENFIITMDGRDLSKDLRFTSDMVSWTEKMKPHQQSKVVIKYSSRGMDYFYYQIPVTREIKNFILTLSIDKLPVSLLNYPDRVITPTEIKSTKDGLGSILTWKLDRSITVMGMGVSLLQPEQPGAQVLRVLVISPYALTLLGAMLAMTMLIWGLKVRFLDLALLSAVYTMQFLLMAAVSDYFLGFWGSLILGAALTLFLTYLLFRKLPSRPLKIIIYILVTFFAIAYPLSGLVSDFVKQNAFNTLLEAGLILYITGLTIFVSSRKPGRKSQD